MPYYMEIIGSLLFLSLSLSRVCLAPVPLLLVVAYFSNHRFMDGFDDGCIEISMYFPNICQAFGLQENHTLTFIISYQRTLRKLLSQTPTIFITKDELYIQSFSGKITLQVAISTGSNILLCRFDECLGNGNDVPSVPRIWSWAWNLRKDMCWNEWKMILMRFHFKNDWAITCNYLIQTYPEIRMIHGFWNQCGFEFSGVGTIECLTILSTSYVYQDFDFGIMIIMP